MPHFVTFDSIYTEPTSDALPEFSLSLHEQNPNSMHEQNPNSIHDNLHGNRTNWDVICDVGTSIKQTSVAESLTNYRPEGFSEVGIRFVQSVDNDHDPGSQLNQGDPFSELDQGVFAPVNVLRSDNRFVIEPVNLFQGLDAGGMNYAEAVGLDSWQGSVDKMPALLNPNKCLN